MTPIKPHSYIQIPTNRRTPIKFPDRAAFRELAILDFPEKPALREMQINVQSVGSMANHKRVSRYLPAYPIRKLVSVDVGWPHNENRVQNNVPGNLCIRFRFEGAGL